MKLVGVIATLALAIPASAHVFPKRAPLLKTTLVQTYAQCVSPDTTTSAGLAACGGEPDPIDTVCGFGNGNSDGTLLTKIVGTKIAIKAKLRGLSPSCNGQTLRTTLGVRPTVDDCPEGHCVVVDQNLTIGTCTVSNGRCVMTGSLETGFPKGSSGEMTVLTCGVSRGDVPTFTCGVMVR